MRSRLCAIESDTISPWHHVAVVTVRRRGSKEKFTSFLDRNISIFREITAARLGRNWNWIQLRSCHSLSLSRELSQPSIEPAFGLQKRWAFKYSRSCAIMYVWYDVANNCDLGVFSICQHSLLSLTYPLFLAPKTKLNSRSATNQSSKAAQLEDCCASLLLLPSSVFSSPPSRVLCSTLTDPDSLLRFTFC